MLQEALELSEVQVPLGHLERQELREHLVHLDLLEHLVCLELLERLEQ